MQKKVDYVPFSDPTLGLLLTLKYVVLNLILISTCMVLTLISRCKSVVPTLVILILKSVDHTLILILEYVVLTPILIFKRVVLTQILVVLTLILISKNVVLTQMYIPLKYLGTHPNSPHGGNNLHPTAGSGYIKGPDVLEEKKRKIRNICYTYKTSSFYAVSMGPYHIGTRVHFSAPRDTLGATPETSDHTKNTSVSGVAAGWLKKRCELGLFFHFCKK